MDRNFSDILDDASDELAEIAKQREPAIEAWRKAQQRCADLNAYRKFMDRASLDGFDEVLQAKWNETDGTTPLVKWASWIVELAEQITKRDDDFWLYEWQAEKPARPELPIAYSVI